MELNFTQSNQSTRNYALDWLRVLAFFILIFFHSAIPFADGMFPVHNVEKSQLMQIIVSFIHGWRMPLLFIVSGCGIWYAFGRRSGAGFIKERCIRLLLPLVVGTLLIVPPQTFFRLLQQGVDYGSYFAFYPHFFEGSILDGGNFTPNHLWYIASLFVISVLLTPLFVLMKSDRGSQWVDRIADFFSKPYRIYTLILPLMIAQLLRWDLFGHPGDFTQILPQIYFVLVGFIIVSRASIWQVIAEQRKISLSIAILNIAAYRYMAWLPDVVFPSQAFAVAGSISLFTLIFAFMGFAKHHLNVSNGFLKYCNEAVYPFYILHQTFTVAFAFYAVQMDIGLWSKYAIVAAGTAIPTLLTYHYLIRPFNVMRVIFGLKQVSRADVKENKPVIGATIGV